MAKDIMEGIASIALLPCGSISGNFIQIPGSICYGLQGTELACEMECSRGEDYRLIKLTIIDYIRKKERVVVVECRGHDAARLRNVDQAHGWEKDVIGMVEKKNVEHKISVSFNCETLKADKAAEDHIRQFMPNLVGLEDIVANVGKMTITGLNLEAENAKHEEETFEADFKLAEETSEADVKLEDNVKLEEKTFETNLAEENFEAADNVKLEQETFEADIKLKEETSEADVKFEDKTEDCS
ncbi:hypothetical protein C5167_005845 [Papaver somniferum]|uniref:Uncharacterized protein n=1 Tax=Papaver somniferum TaxID=3469 RepID=A0A4Y7JES0_PAPSO|nr:uncharacterized protein LOC113273975 [Papaver somniferum]RZC58542.1 hypothetical protein C5167_005845 [Papaver somniferum]